MWIKHTHYNTKRITVILSSVGNYLNSTGVGWVEDRLVTSMGISILGCEFLLNQLCRFSKTTTRIRIITMATAPMPPPMAPHGNEEDPRNVVIYCRECYHYFNYKFVWAVYFPWHEHEYATWYDGLFYSIQLHSNGVTLVKNVIIWWTNILK